MIRQLIREILLNEAAMRPVDLPVGMYVKIEKSNTRIQVSYYKKNYNFKSDLFGSISAISNPDSPNGMCSNAFIISLSSAKKGWGPLLYDVLMEVATEMGKGLTPDRRSLSDSAKRVWSYYFSNRGDISKNVLDYKKSPFITPSDERDDCRSDVVETDWEYKNKEDGELFNDYYVKSPLNYVYFSNGTPMINKLRKMTLLIED